MAKSKHKQNGKKRSERATGQRAREIAAARKGIAAKVLKARSAWADGRHSESLRTYEQALTSDPKNVALIVEVATAYGQRYDYHRANELIDRADKLAPAEAATQALIGDLYIKLQDFESAERCYRHLLGLKPDQKQRVRAQVALARIYERLHRIDEATQIVEQAISDWPEHPNANFYAAKLLDRAGNTEASSAAFKQLTSRTDISAEIKANAWYELAKQHDQAGTYDQAYAALLEAKNSYSGQTDQPRRVAKKIAENNELMLSTITSEHFQRWADWSSQLSPLPSRLAWLVGHPRSGTTLIEQVLDSHQGLVSADELDVLARCIYPELGAKSGDERAAPDMLDRAQSNDVNQARTDYWQKTESALREPVGQRMLLDKNPELTLLLPMICRTFPKSKVLFALRDPRDVVISCFSQSLPLNSVSVHYLTLEDTANKYAAVMHTWLKLRSMINLEWLEVRYEDTVTDMESQARKVLDFLGLPWDDAVLDYRRHATEKHVHSPTYEAVTKPVYTSSIGRWKNYAAQLEPCLPVLQPFLEEFGYA